MANLVPMILVILSPHQLGRIADNTSQKGEHPLRCLGAKYFFPPWTGLFFRDRLLLEKSTAVGQQLSHQFRKSFNCVQLASRDQWIALSLLTKLSTLE